MPKPNRWLPIACAPRGRWILLGRLAGDACLWAASGILTEDGMRIDFLDAPVQPTGFQGPTHWMPMPVVSVAGQS